MRLGVKNYSWICLVLLVGCYQQDAPETAQQDVPTSGQKPDGQYTSAVSNQLASPVRLTADGEPIDIGKLSPYAHAGPWIADVDCDGDRDLLVGDFPGHFWFFENENDDEAPEYVSKGKLEAGGVAAKTPVY